VFIKDIRNQEGGCLVRAFADKGILQMWTSALFGAKIFEFFEVYGVSHE